MSNNIHPIMQRIKPIFYQQCWESGIVLAETAGTRSLLEQWELVKSGASQTMASNHLPFVIPDYLDPLGFDKIQAWINMGKILLIGSRAFDAAPLLPDDPAERMAYLANLDNSFKNYVEIYTLNPQAWHLCYSDEDVKLAKPIFEIAGRIWEGLTPQAQKLAREWKYKYPDETKCQHGIIIDDGKQDLYHFQINLGN